MKIKSIRELNKLKREGEQQILPQDYQDTGGNRAVWTL